MNSKITLPELVTLLAERSGLSKRQCEIFVKSLFANISASLVKHENVKIKGLGTFKLTEIDSRKSVDVNTGLEIEIAGHYRVSFIAEKTLAELINRPFEAFESVEINEGVTDEMLEAAEESIEVEEAEWTPKPEEEEATTISEYEIDEEEPAEALEEVIPQAMPDTPLYSIEDIEKTEVLAAEADTADEEPEVKTIVSKQVEAIVTSPVEETVMPEQTPAEAGELQPVDSSGRQPLFVKHNLSKVKAAVATPVSPEVQKVTPTVPPAPIEADEEIVEPERTIETRKEKKSFFGWAFIAGLLTGLVILSVVAVILYNRKDAAEEVQPEVAVAVVDSAIETDTLPQDSLPSVEAPEEVIEDTPAEPEKPIEKIEPKKVEEESKAATKPSDALKYDTIGKQRYLTTMAKAYYGNYHLWPYIYEANKGLGHPDKINYGTKIRIPDISELGIDPKDPAVIAEAKRKGAAIYKQYESQK